MLPPIDPAVLSANPKFETLYRDLSANRLDEDGTSISQDKDLQERQARSEDLRRARTETARRELVRSSLQSLSHRADELPTELQELVGVIVALIDGRIPAQDLGLLHDEIEKFKDNIAPIAAAISTQLQRDTASLAQMIDIDEPPPSVSELPAAVQKVKADLSADRAALHERRLALASEAASVSKLQQQALEKSIRILERTMHGALTRGTRARADYLALVAEVMGKKLGVQRAQLVSPLASIEVQRGLRAMGEGLKDEGRSMRRQIRDGEERLREHRSSSSTGVAGIAAEYVEVLRETERVKEEIRRLERQ